MESTDAVKKKLRRIKPILRRDYNVKDIGVFGSYSTGKNQPDSDIDLLVSFSGHIGWKFFDLKIYLEEELGLKVDLVTERSLKKRLRDKVIDQTHFI